jgi:cobalt-zinc-cadmium efflux system outer membrane protein
MKTMTAFAVVGALCLAPTATRAETITIDQALARASQRPSVQEVALDVDAARARARGAALPLYNPELSGSGGPQFGSGARSLQLAVGLSQTIELGGKRKARTDVADAEIHGVEALRGVELLAARVEAWRAFERALVMRERLATRHEVEQLAATLATAMQRTAQAGGTTKLRVNVIDAEAGRTRQERIAAEIDYANVVAQLATAIGADPGAQLEPTGTLGEPRALVEPVDEVVARALRAHLEIAASESGLLAAHSRIADADARGVPDLTLGVGYAYAPDPDGSHAIVGTVSIPLGIRNRNQGERAAARVGAQRAEVERVRVRSEIERRARLAYANYQRTRDGASGFDREVTERLHDNLTAAQEAFSKGGLDFVELTTTQRDLVAARIAFLDTRLAAIDAWAELALASGMEVAP